jgi:hypothetical protein
LLLFLALTSCDLADADALLISRQEAFHMWKRPALLFALAAVAFSPAFAQNSRSQSAPEATSSIPVRIDICEYPKIGNLEFHHCGVLTWNGQKYDSTFEPLIGPNGRPVDLPSVGEMTMTRTGNNITFDRHDSQGTEGSAQYSGTLSGDKRATGDVTWRNDHGVFHGTFTADLTFPSPPAQQSISSVAPSPAQSNAAQHPSPSQVPDHTSGANQSDSAQTSAIQAASVPPSTGLANSAPEVNAARASGKSVPDLNGVWMFNFLDRRFRCKIIQQDDEVSIVAIPRISGIASMDMFRGKLAINDSIIGHIADNPWILGNVGLSRPSDDNDIITIESLNKLTLKNGGIFTRGAQPQHPSVVIPPELKSEVEFARTYINDCASENVNAMLAVTIPEQLDYFNPVICKGWAKSHQGLVSIDFTAGYLISARNGASIQGYITFSDDSQFRVIIDEQRVNGHLMLFLFTVFNKW